MWIAGVADAVHVDIDPLVVVDPRAVVDVIGDTVIVLVVTGECDVDLRVRRWLLEADDLVATGEQEDQEACAHSVIVSASRPFVRVWFVGECAALRIDDAEHVA
jgi:hypothetical protein